MTRSRPEQTIPRERRAKTQPGRRRKPGEDANPEPVYTKEMKPDVLREAGSKYGLTFPVGTTKADMAEAINAAAAAGSPS